MMTGADINLWAVLIAAIVYMGIGAIWFSPGVFGNLRTKLSHADKPKKVGRSYLIGFLAALIMCYIFAHLIFFMGISTVAGGAKMGIWIWLGFFATTSLGMVIWDNKPFKLYLISTLYDLVSLMVMGIILANWI